MRRLGVAICPAFGPAARGEAALPDDFAPLVRRLMARDRIPGVAVGVVERGDLVFACGFGHRDVESRLPVTPDTLFPLGSCSKAFTATAIALLVDEGRIGLDTPVRTYLPDFSLQDPVASATLTPRDLLTHRSGLPRHDLFWYEAPFSRDELYRRLRFLEPAGPPRGRWRYNSLMFVVAARIVEKVSGQRWESFVETRILRPLNMRRTVLSPEAMETDADHSSPHALREGRAQPIPMLKGLDAIAPAGAVQSSVRDLAHWLAFHATRSPVLLQERLWHELHRPQAEMPASDQPEGQHRFYALGWIHESYRGHTLVAHDGAIDGFTAHLGFIPQTGQGLIVLANREGATAALTALAYSAYDRLLGREPLDWERRLEETSQPLQADRRAALDFPIAELVGTYEHPGYGLLAIQVEGDTLVMQFRSLRLALAYQGGRRFLSLEEVVDSAPQISVQFSKPKAGEPLRLLVPLNFDDAGDPVEAFTRLR
jgi:CubicO group peptidase (beta-lactamase class C family)